MNQKFLKKKLNQKRMILLFMDRQCVVNYDNKSKKNEPRKKVL